MNVAKFLASVGPADPVTGCREFMRARQSMGYGYLRFEGRNQLAQRVAWQIANGPIPDGMDVLHRCDNPPCCEPTHLFTGSHADNMRDKCVKGRQPTGERHGMSKLTDADIEDARTRFASGSILRGAVTFLAREFGVTRGYMRKILRGTVRREVAHF